MDFSQFPRLLFFSRCSSHLSPILRAFLHYLDALSPVSSLFFFSPFPRLSGRLEQANYPNSRRLEEGIGALILSDTIHIIKPSTMTIDNKNKIILILTSTRSTFHVGPVWV